MHKKIIYIVMVLMLGLVVYAMAGSSIQRRHITNILREAVQTGDHETINRMGVNFHNPVLLGKQVNDDVFLGVYESAVIHERRDSNNRPEMIIYKTLTILLIGLGDVDLNQNQNQARISFFNNDDESRFYLVYDGAQNPTNRNHLLLDDSRNLVRNYNNMSFIRFNLRLDDLVDNVLYVTLFDARGDEVTTRSTGGIRKDTEFFEQINILNDKLEKYQELDDPAAFNEFYSEWLEGFKYSDFLVAPLNSEVFGLGVHVRVFAVVGVYIVLMSLLGIYIFRRKDDVPLDVRRAI